MNNPVYFLDPDGMLSESFIDKMKNSADGTTWTNNNNGTFSSNSGQTIDNNGNNQNDEGDPKKAQIKNISKGIGDKVLNNVTPKTTLGKIWSSLQGNREWTSDLGLTYWVDDKGEIIGLKPTGGEGMLGLIGGAGAFEISRMAGFYIRSKTFISGGVYTKTIQSLASLEEGTSMIKLIKGMEVEAKSSGAKKIVIKGIDIVNKKLINTEAARRLGYTVEKATETTITISKKL